MLKYYCANIHLLEDEIVFENWIKKVNIQRSEKVLRCKNSEDKLRSLMAGVLFRLALEREGIEYGSIEVSTTSDGKPILESHPKLHFSISHSKDYVGVILSDRQVGLDIESSQKLLFQNGKEERMESVANKCLSSLEWKCFSTLSEEDKKKKFLEYWTKKECYSKAIGKGMKMDFSLIDTETNKEKYWSTWTTDGYCVSIYVEDADYTGLQIEKIKHL